MKKHLAGILCSALILGNEMGNSEPVTAQTEISNQTTHYASSEGWSCMQRGERRSFWFFQRRNGLPYSLKDGKIYGLEGKFLDNQGVSPQLNMLGPNLTIGEESFEFKTTGRAQPTSRDASFWVNISCGVKRENPNKLEWVIDIEANEKFVNIYEKLRVYPSVVGVLSDLPIKLKKPGRVVQDSPWVDMGGGIYRKIMTTDGPEIDFKASRDNDFKKPELGEIIIYRISKLGENSSILREEFLNRQNRTTYKRVY